MKRLYKRFLKFLKKDSFPKVDPKLDLTFDPFAIDSSYHGPVGYKKKSI